MRVQATNPNGIGNRLRCFLAALRINREATIYWHRELNDTVTKPELLTGTIDPFESLFLSDRSCPLDEEAWKVPKFSYYITAAEAGNRSIFCLYGNMDPRAKKAYLDLRREFLIPHPDVVKLAVKNFAFGFQIRSKRELIDPPKSEIHESVFDFIRSAKFPIFVAVDNQELANDLGQNPNVFMFSNKHKFDFDLEWNWSLAEILTMANCKTLYVTPGSTYGEMGYLFSDYKAIVRDAHQPVPIEDRIYYKGTRTLII